MYPLPLQPLVVGHGTGRFPAGPTLGLEVVGHGAVVVFTHIQIVHVGPIYGPFPVTALLPHHFEIILSLTVCETHRQNDLVEGQALNEESI